MKRILLFLMLFVPLLVSAQDKQYYIYNIVTFEGNFKKEGLKVSIDNGKTVEKLKAKEENRIKFNTPASALMYFISKGWELYVNGSTSEGSSISIDGTGSGGTSTTSYWILRKSCSKEEFDNAVKECFK